MLKKVFGYWSWMPAALLLLMWTAASVGQGVWKFWILFVLLGVWMLCRVIYVYTKHMVAAYRGVKIRRQVKADTGATDYMEEDHDVAVAANPDGVLIPKTHTIFASEIEQPELDDVGSTVAVFRCVPRRCIVVLVLSVVLMIAPAAGAGATLGTYRSAESYFELFLALLFGSAACYAGARLIGSRVEVCERAVVTYLTNGLAGQVLYYRGFAGAEEQEDDVAFFREDGSREVLLDRDWSGVAAILPYVQQYLPAQSC